MAAAFDTLQNIMAATRDQLVALEDFGEVMAQSVCDYFADADNVDFVGALLQKGVSVTRPQRTTEGVFAGETVVLTGTLDTYKRSQAAQLIAQRGGMVADSVSSRVTLVVAGADAGSKLAKAQKLGIRIIDETEFLQLLQQ